MANPYEVINQPVNKERPHYQANSPNNFNNQIYSPPNDNQWNNQNPNYNQYNQNPNYNQYNNPNPSFNNYPPPPPPNNPYQAYNNQPRPVINAQPVYVNPIGVPLINNYGVNVICPICRKQTSSITTKRAGSTTWIWCFVLFLFTGCLCCIPFCVDSCQDTQIRCINCQCVKSRIVANCV